MKCIVIYFSQTGNTERIARAIQTGVKQTAGHCEIVPIKEANPRRLYDYDLIGVGSPVWGMVPENVKIFIKNMRFVGGKHAFGFCTHGSLYTNFFPSVIPRLKDRGLLVIGAGDWYGSCTLYHHFDPYPTAGHPDEIDCKEAEEFGREMVERSRKVSAGETSLIIPSPPPLSEAALPPLPPGISMEAVLAGVNTIKKFPTMLKFHKEKCTYPECRLCMDNCPMDGIDLTVNPPVIAKPCVSCEFCARICPTGAIDIHDWLEMMPQGYELMELVILSELAKDEAKGHFRRLLPIEKVGKTLNYKRHTKHPQWIIGKGLQ